MAVLPGVLGCRHLRRTVLVRLRTNTLRLPGGTPIFVVSRQQIMKYPGLNYGGLDQTNRVAASRINFPMGKLRGHEFSAPLKSN
ncbi:MAG: hypothetical protein OET42_10630 [Deltaproteobacteria bacterium]|nr:hypothetical protein [Deltaproteobacteria bacterium]